MKGLGLVMLALLMAWPAQAQDFGYMPEDARLLQACINAVTATDEGATKKRNCIGVASVPCETATPDGQTTVGMMTCTLREAAWWDEQLNRTYTALKEALQSDAFDTLRDAQKAWIAYRDASCAFEYKYWEGGTIRVLFHSSCVLQRTAERAIELGEILDWTKA